jgi:hypothetical protein
MPRTPLVVAAVLVALAARAPRAETPAAAPPHAEKGGAAAARAPAKFAVNTGVCKDFLALPADLRGMVVAWTAGRYHKKDRWVLDEDTARKVVAGVVEACEKTPEGLFRYKVVAEVDKLK